MRARGASIRSCRRGVRGVPCVAGRDARDEKGAIMASDSQGLWPKPPDAAMPVVDEEREIDDVDEVPDEEFIVDDEEPGIDADERIAPEDDDYEDGR